MTASRVPNDDWDSEGRVNDWSTFRVHGFRVDWPNSVQLANENVRRSIPMFYRERETSINRSTPGTDVSAWTRLAARV